MGKFRVYIAIVMANVLWAFSFVWVKDAYLSFNPIGLITTRLVIATGIMFLFLYATKQLNNIKRSDLGGFMGIALLEPFIYFLGESFGLKYVSSTLAAVIISTIPLFTPFVARIILKERISGNNIIGIILSITGVILIVLNGDMQFAASLKGVGLMFVAVAAAIFYPSYLNKLAKKYNGVTIIAFQNLFGLLYFLPLFVWIELPDFFTKQYESKSLVAAGLLSIFASIIAFVLYTYSVRKLGVAKSSNFINLIPAFTAIIAFFYLGETFGAGKVLGIAIVVCGLYISQLKNIRNPLQ